MTQETTNLTLGERLRAALNMRNKTASELAKATDVSQAGVKKWLDGDTQSLKYADAVAAASFLRVKPDWLALGRGDMTDHVVEAGELVKIERLNVRASCGHVVAMPKDDPEIIQMTASAEWFWKNFPRRSSETVKVIEASGDSMSPSIQDGDAVFVDTAMRVCDRDGVYLFNLDDQLMIKRIQRLPNHSLLLISENPKYRDIELDSESQHSLNIIGFVIKALRFEDVA